jgi:hypothetical protein
MSGPICGRRPRQRMRRRKSRPWLRADRGCPARDGLGDRAGETASWRRRCLMVGVASGRADRAVSRCPTGGLQHPRRRRGWRPGSPSSPPGPPRSPWAMTAGWIRTVGEVTATVMAGDVTAECTDDSPHERTLGLLVVLGVEVIRDPQGLDAGSVGLVGLLASARAERDTRSFTGIAEGPSIGGQTPR